jgi:transcriptional regulator with XRE-family HTH domain
MAVTGLRKRRLALSMTQRQLAVAMGVHWNSVARWERGEMTMLWCHELMLRSLEVQACTATAAKK